MTCPSCQTEVIEYEWGASALADYGRADRIARGLHVQRDIECPECGATIPGDDWDPDED